MHVPKLLVFLVLFLSASGIFAATPDCTFPSRASEPFVWVNAGNGGNWEKTIRNIGTQRGYFRFIYYAKAADRSIKLYVEAWEYMTVGHDLFVGCMEIKDPRIAKASEAGDFKFRPTESGDEATYLDMTIYEKRLGEPKPYSVKIPLKFINNIS